MNEAEWLTCDDPRPMLEFLQATDRLSERKGRLFAVASCRRIWYLLDNRSRLAAEAAELFADGLLTSRQLHAAAKGIPRTSGRMTLGPKQAFPPGRAGRTSKKT